MELNRLGERIPRDQRRAVAVVRAELRIDRLWTHQHLDRAPVHAHLSPPCLEPLYNAKIRYWRGRNVVLVGTQRVLLPGRNAAGTFEQLWWCRLVVDTGSGMITVQK